MESKENNNQLNLGQLSNTINTFGKALLIKKLVPYILGGIALIIGGIIYWKNSIKKEALKNIPLPPLPQGEVIDPSKGINTNAEFEAIARKYANDLFDEIDGWFATATTKEVIFKKLWALNDTQLVYVYRVYSKFYYEDNNETMTEAIKREKYVVLETFGGLQNKLVKRLQLLGAE